MADAFPGSRWRQAIVRLVLLAGLWLGLNGLDGSSWILGAPSIAAATAISLALAPAPSCRIAPAGVLPFVLFFLRQSLAGGVDVARRAISPALRLDPDVIEFPLHLPSPQARTFFCAVLSLLPGTAAVELGDESLLVHALDRTAPVASSLADLEARVAHLFGLQLSGSSGVRR